MLLLLAWPLLAWSSPLPEKPPIGHPLGPSPEFGGFKPLPVGRGVGPSSGYGSPPPAPTYGAPVPKSYGGGPTKTIYVNVPPYKAGPPPPPVAAGPPRKHYKIVFIRAPPPPPQAQAILPPRTEQKTLIYVLHQRPNDQQQVVEVPHVPHDPEVYFVEYDSPPTAQDLQQLSAGNLDGFTVTSQQGGGYGGGGAGLGLGAGLQVSAAHGDDLYKRSVATETSEAAAATADSGGVEPLIITS